MIEPYKKYLITTDAWFVGPDGEHYKAVWGECEIIKTEDALGFTPTRPSTNWFLKVGSINNYVIIAGCQIHYAIFCPIEPVDNFRDIRYVDKDTNLEMSARRIYKAN